MQVTRQELNEYGIPKIRVDEADGFAMEFEIVPVFKTSDLRSYDVVEGLRDVNIQLNENEKDIQTVKSQIDANTSQADRIDITVAAGFGVIAGIIDALWVGEFNIGPDSASKQWSDKTVNNFVIKTAQEQGYNGDNLEGAIRHMEDMFPCPTDDKFKFEKSHMNTYSHHIDDFSHHPTPFGMLCSIITQFKGKGYFQNHNGTGFWLDANGDLIGDTVGEKLYAGTHNWFMHLVSDMAGSRGTPGGGMGIPGPILSVAKELSAIVGFSPLQINAAFTKGRFNLRSEMAALYEFGRQAIPVIINEILVRSFYFIRRLNSEIKRARSIELVNWRNVLPFKNATITRMITVASATFAAIDIGDAGIRAVVSGSGWKGFLLRINYVNMFRFTLSMVDEAGYAIKRANLRDNLDKLVVERLALMNLKISYQQQGVWLVAKDTVEVIRVTELAFRNYAAHYAEYREAFDSSMRYVNSALGINSSKRISRSEDQSNMDFLKNFI